MLTVAALLLLVAADLLCVANLLLLLLAVLHPWRPAGARLGEDRAV